MGQPDDVDRCAGPRSTFPSGTVLRHERELRAGGLSATQIHEGLRIASVVFAACSTLAAEGVLAPA